MTAKDILTATFNNRESYLAWSTEWKRIYAEISEDIRALKQVHGDKCRNPMTWVKCSDNQTNKHVLTRPWTDAETKRLERATPAIKRSADAYRNGFKSLSALATALLFKRRWSKQEAQRQFVAAHQAVPA